MYGSVSIQGHGFLYSPNTNFVGSDSFTYRVYDNDLYSNIANISINVTPSNDPPEIIDISSQQIDEDSILELQLLADDIDQDELIFEAICDYADCIVDNDM